MKKHTEQEIEQAKKILKESGYLLNLWSKPDIDGLCKEHKLKKIKDIKDFFEYVERKHDASIGINWDSLLCYIEMYLEKSN